MMTSRREFRTACTAAVLLTLGLLGACTGDKTIAPPDEPEVRITRIAGDSQVIGTSDTSNWLIAQVLEDGVPAPGMVVAWNVLAGTGAVLKGVDTTDAGGYTHTIFVAGADTGLRRIAASAGNAASSFAVRVVSSPPPPSESCIVGVLHPGEMSAGALSETSCRLGDQYSSPYRGYLVPFQQGLGYLIRVERLGPSGIDPVLWLTAKDTWEEIHALSDDDGDGIDSELLFIAPTTDTLQALASTFLYQQTGTYQISVQSCPVLATLAATGVHNLTLPSGLCLRRSGFAPHLTRYALLAIPVAPFDSLTLRVSSSAFVPMWEASAPGWDTFGWTTGQDYAWATGQGEQRSLKIGATGGVVTLAVGGTMAEAVGAFTVTLARVSIAAPPEGSRGRRAMHTPPSSFRR